MIPELAAAARARYSHAASAGSQLAREVAETDDFTREAIRNGVHIAGLRLLAAEDHLAGLGALIADETIVYSTHTVARSAAEISAWAWWLLDTTLSGRQRAERSLTDRFHSLLEQHRTGISGVREHVEPRIARLRAQAERGGYPLTASTSASWRTAEQRPTSSALMAMVYGQPVEGEPSIGKPVYQLLSAFSHGTGYALTNVLQPATTVDADGLIWAQVTTNANVEATVVTMATTPYIHALDAQMSLHGWRDERLEVHLQNLRKRLGRALAEEV